MKSSVDRMADKEKTGAFTGSYAINPLTQKPIPIWIADYVLADYGSGAIMCVPAHDERDFEFAKKFNLSITPVIQKEEGDIQEITEPYTGEGKMINSGQFNGISSEEAKEVIATYLEEQQIGKKTVSYKLRDWVFSRQRYWGEPIPIIHCEKCGATPVPEHQLPVTLPEVESYELTGTGESPWQPFLIGTTTCPRCGEPARRETNTMPQWAGSSWYYLRYVDPYNEKEIIDKDKAKEWLPVDMYVGGIEHAVLHLLYVRFYTKFFYDIGVIDFEEPFTFLFNQGMITKDGIKMSKSKGNVVSPDDLVNRYGCDSLRMYELFVGPPELDSEWDDRGIEGVYRFINKVWNLIAENATSKKEATEEMERLRHQMIYEITTRLDQFNLNTVVVDLWSIPIS